MNEKITEIFEKDSKFGIKCGEKLLLAPRYETIGGFIGGYAMVNKQFFVDENGIIFKNRKSNGDIVLQLIAGGFAKVKTVRGEILYRDWITNEKWYAEPDEFIKLDFIKLIRIKDLYYLRTTGRFIKVAFKEEDLHINGNVFQKRNAINNKEVIFIHRALPDKVFIFIGYNQDMSKRLLPYSGGAYYYVYRKKDRKPIVTKEKILPIETNEYRLHLKECKLFEHDVQNALRMKKLTTMGRNLLAK